MLGKERALAQGCSAQGRRQERWCVSDGSGHLELQGGLRNTGCRGKPRGWPCRGGKTASFNEWLLTEIK